MLKTCMYILSFQFHNFGEKFRLPWKLSLFKTQKYHISSAIASKEISKQLNAPSSSFMSRRQHLKHIIGMTFLHDSVTITNHNLLNPTKAIIEHNCTALRYHISGVIQNESHIPQKWSAIKVDVLLCKPPHQTRVI